MLKKLTGLTRAELIEAYRSLQQSESHDGHRPAPDATHVVEDVPPAEVKEPEDSKESKEDEEEEEEDDDSDMDIVHRPD